MLDAIDVTAQDTISRIDAIKNLMDSCAEFVQEKAPGIYSRDLIELIFQEPYCKINWLIEKGIAKRQTASTYLNTLVDWAARYTGRRYEDLNDHNELRHDPWVLFVVFSHISY